MEVVNSNEKFLCNLEVLTFLKELKEKDKKLLKFQKNLATIAYETTKYLEDVQIYSQVREEQVRSLLVQLKDFNLTKTEKLQIVNQRPVTLVELQLLIEENEERFSEEAMENLLDVISKLLPIDIEVQQTHQQSIDQ